MRRVAIACLLAVLWSNCASAQDALRSPWDVHPVKVTGARYDCGKDIDLTHDITLADYYSDAKHSIIDPARHAAYEAAAAPFQALLKSTEAAADEFQQSGSREAAACVVHLLAVVAREDAMTGAMSTNQAYYVQGWTLGGVAIAMLKARPAAAGSDADRALIAAWMKRVASSTHDYFQGRWEQKTDAQNNHLYWAGLAVLAAGVVANDRADYDWGILTYRKGVDSIAPDGTLPLEMARGQRALHYHLFALAPLVVLAEFGEANGEPMYAYRGGALKLLVDRSVAGMLDPTFFVAKAGVAQEGDYRHPAGGDISWAVPYTRRFPNPAISRVLQQAKSLKDAYLGGLPPP